LAAGERPYANMESFSAVINGIQENRTHNAAHEILTVTPPIPAAQLTHDVKGNLTHNKNGHDYSWDVENRLIQAVVHAGEPGIAGTHSYSYDALGRRVSKTVNGVTTIFINNAYWQEVAEYQNGTLVQSYVFGDNIDENIAIVKADGMRLFYYSNDLLSIYALTNDSGIVVERCIYDPYGKGTVLAADGVTTQVESLYGNSWMFTGRRLDNETGLMYYRSRMYDVVLGQFIGRDPLDHQDDRIRFSTRGAIRAFEYYLYVDGNPSIYVDPWGLTPLDSATRARVINGLTRDNLVKYGNYGFCIKLSTKMAESMVKTAESIDPQNKLLNEIANAYMRGVSAESELYDKVANLKESAIKKELADKNLEAIKMWILYIEARQMYLNAQNLRSQNNSDAGDRINRLVRSQLAAEMQVYSLEIKGGSENDTKTALRDLNDIKKQLDDIRSAAARMPANANNKLATLLALEHDILGALNDNPCKRCRSDEALLANIKKLKDLLGVSGGDQLTDGAFKDLYKKLNSEINNTRRTTTPNN
jgi:RHS repeat-associated protein